MALPGTIWRVPREDRTAIITLKQGLGSFLWREIGLKHEGTTKVYSR